MKKIGKKFYTVGYQTKNAKKGHCKKPLCFLKIPSIKTWES